MAEFLALWLYLELAARRARRRRQALADYVAREQPTPHVCPSCDRPLVAAS